jgi:hypothetical protein
MPGKRYSKPSKVESRASQGGRVVFTDFGLEKIPRIAGGLEVSTL